MCKLKFFKKHYLSSIIFIIIFWFMGVSVYQRMVCPTLTEMELFINMGKNFILNFIYC